MSELVSKHVSIKVEPRTVYDVSYSTSEDYSNHCEGSVGTITTVDSYIDANRIASALAAQETPNDKTTVELLLYLSPEEKQE